MTYMCQIVGVFMGTMCDGIVFAPSLTVLEIVTGSFLSGALIFHCIALGHLQTSRVFIEL